MYFVLVPYRIIHYSIWSNLALACEGNILHKRTVNHTLCYLATRNRVSIRSQTLARRGLDFGGARVTVALSSDVFPDDPHLDDRSVMSPSL